jgi:hypothetical protein
VLGPCPNNQRVSDNNLKNEESGSGKAVSIKRTNPMVAGRKESDCKKKRQMVE